MAYIGSLFRQNEADSKDTGWEQIKDKGKS